MNLPVLKKRLALFFSLSALLFSACTKIVTTELGGDLIPPVDGVNTKEMYLDVTSINATDTITRIGLSLDHALGYVNDPLFGKTTASINVQLKPSFPLVWPASKDSMFIDSVVMVLSYKGFWGDSLKPLSFRVYNILADGDSTDVNLSPDSAYKTNRVVPRGQELTENFTAKTVYPYTLNDSIYPFMEQASNQLRIRLNASYGTSLLRLDTSFYKYDSLFDGVIKGYQIVPEQNLQSNALLRINLLDTNTKLAIYFRYKKEGKMDTTVRYFHTNSYTSGSSNYIVRDRTGSQAAGWLAHNGSTNDSLLFIDANPGIYAKLQIPGLDTDTISNKIIHRAEILMEQDPDPTNPEEKYLTPPNLFLTPFSLDSMRRFGLPNDIQYGSGYVANQFLLGCYPYTKKDPNTGLSIYAYRFDISRYVQGIVSRHEKTYNLVLFAPFNDYIYTIENTLFTAFTGTSLSDPLNPGPAMGRVRLGGGSSVQHKMKLHIVYSDVFK
jgi:hypothetical protein